MQIRKISNLIFIAILQIVGFIFMLPLMVASENGDELAGTMIYGTLIGLVIVIFSQIYFVYWYYKTSVEIKNKGYYIPIFILYFIPIVNFYWLWKYSEGVEGVTKGKLQTILVFIVNFLLSIPLAPIILQYYFNKTPVTKKVVATKQVATKKS